MQHWSDRSCWISENYFTAGPEGSGSEPDQPGGCYGEDDITRFHDDRNGYHADCEKRCGVELQIYRKLYCNTVDVHCDLFDLAGIIWFTGKKSGPVCTKNGFLRRRECI